MEKKKLKSISIIGATAAFTAVFCMLAFGQIPSSDAAIRATDFKAGRIIDDEVFYNSKSMTVAQIQAHLDKYLPECDMWGTKPVGSGRYINGKAVNANTRRVDYARMMRENGNSNYHDAPYVCVNKYYENPNTHENSYDTKGKVKSGMISAAQIIYNVAQDYSINPQVLLVMLKKESYVWGDSWPLRWEYNTVMGYACPDGAPCNTKYYGFYNQVKMAAWQLDYYKKHINSYNYHPYRNNNILYSPDRSCGTKTVYLENYATTSLYIYTPYTPNDAALANYPGTATCGSYGNRNFFMYFAEWFGSPLYTKNTQQTTTPAPEDPITTVSKDPQGAKMIAKYKTLKNQGTDLGTLLESKIHYDSKTGMRWITFEKGFIVGTEKYGYFESLLGSIRSVWAASGYQNGKFGVPISSINNDPKTGMYWQQFQNGYIVGSSKTGYYESMNGPIREVWAKNGYQNGVLGMPLENIMHDSKTGMYWQQFQNGYIVGSDATGYYKSMNGPIRDVWAKNGYQNGVLGMPTSEIIRNSSAKTQTQVFQNGQIVYSEETGEAKMILKNEN